jgi:hypothetical protein
MKPISVNDFNVTNLNIILHMKIVDNEWIAQIGVLDGLIQWEPL